LGSILEIFHYWEDIFISSSHFSDTKPLKAFIGKVFTFTHSYNSIKLIVMNFLETLLEKTLIKELIGLYIALIPILYNIINGGPGTLVPVLVRYIQDKRKHR
jgi:hypothetical protein